MDRMDAARNARRAIERITHVIAERIDIGVPSLEELAALAGMSRSGLSRRFRRVVGISLSEYVQDLRLRRAALLLSTTTHSATAIAQDSGFYDLPHLDKAFRQRFGVTPRQFRSGRGATSQG